MADTTFPPLPPDIGSLTGPPFLGIFLDGFLYGILTLQYYNYCSDFQNDLTWLRNLVHVQFLLETAQTAMTVADGFHWFVYGYGDLSKLGEYYLANFDSPMLCSVIALISQGVYCWRIYHLSRWKLPTLIIIVTACCQAAGGFGIGIVNQRLGSIDKWDSRFNVFMIMWSLCSAIADSIIAGIMTYLLLASNPFGAKKKRTPVVKRLTRVIIETNLASALVAVTVFLTTVISPIAPPKTSFFLCPGYVLGKLYSNSFITMLNNRRRSGGIGGTEESATEGLSIGNVNMSMERRHQSSASRQLKHVVSPNLSIAVHTETSVSFDGGDPIGLPGHDAIAKRSMLPIMS